MSATTVATSTFLQRARIREALKDTGLPTAYVTDQHAAVLKRAELAPQYGMPVHAFLRGISYSAAARLLNALRHIEEPA
ncbi:hypothetical protein [Pseudoxanthomonas mexicana]|uniref:hypothetical protein n=1 Tax=Pseudoxanthomonas mexicana TaxID=128785 RepID=UPI00398B547D